MPQQLPRESDTVYKLRRDFELTFGKSSHWTDRMDRAGKGYCDPNINTMWLAWILSYETYVGSTQN